MARKRVLSITHTVLIWAGVLLAITGTMVSVLGITDSIYFEAELGSLKVKATNLGLTILLVGALLSGIVALRLPNDLRVFSSVRPSLTERLAQSQSTITAAFLLLAAILGIMIALR